jgi:5,10-methylenetetrahydromethanopterin reductase
MAHPDLTSPNKPVTCWVLQMPDPLPAAAAAPGLEADGWDGIYYGDNQCRVGDCILALVLAAQATEQVWFSTGCTNAVTRHPTVLASAWVNLQQISGGRMALGVGRGDSALADIGLAMQPSKAFERSMSQVRALLAGESVSFDPTAGADGVEGLSTLGYANNPTASRLDFFDPSLPRVPLDLTVAGPRNIGVAARQADWITFSVGAEPERLRWGVDLAREEATKAGRDPDTLSYGAYIQVICNDDRAAAAQMGKSAVAVHARFQGLHGKGSAKGPMNDEDRRIVESVAQNYDMTVSGKGGSQVELISDDFASRFAVWGPPEECIERLRAVIDCGIDRIVVSAPLQGGTPEQRRENLARITSEVIPALRDVRATV